jgi:hypothetical protein
MQVVLWAVLGGTLGLAQWITSTRQRTPISLEPPERLGPVMVQLPAKWTRLQESQDDELAVEQPGVRELVVSLEDGPTEPGKPIEFKGLHQTGHLLTLPHSEQGPDGTIMQDFEMVAWAPLPTGGAVAITLLTRRQSSEDQRLLQAVANGITLAKRKPPKVRPRSVPLHPDDFD